MPRIVVMDTETTGLIAGKHDIIQLACIALNPNFTPDKTTQPFFMLIQPMHYPYNDATALEAYTADIKGAMDVNGLDIKKVIEKGFHWVKAAELFEEWWKTISEGQKIEPLCQNYPFDSSFMKEWLGREHYDYFFSRYYRDTYAATRFLRDRSVFFGEKDPFPEGHSLKKVATALNVPLQRGHDALEDCIATAAVYYEACKFIGLTRHEAAKD